MPAVQASIPPQDRAALYALLSALLLQPQPALIEGLAALPAADADEPLALAWDQLVRAAQRSGPAGVREEFDCLFVAAGTPRLNPYQCYYVAGWLMDKPLAALRHDLQHAGLARLPGATELEDHIGALCEAMHVLVASDRPPALQRDFFRAHLAGWSRRCLEDIAAACPGGFHEALAGFAMAFFAAETRLLDLEDAPDTPAPPRTPKHVAATA